jgi:hypothetical protein
VRKVAGEGESRLAKRYQALESDWLKQTWQTFKELTRPPMLRDVLQTLDVGESMLTDKH